MIQPIHIIEGIEHLLGRDVIASQRVHTASDRRTNPAARISIEEMLRYADWAAVQVVAQVQAQHLRGTGLIGDDGYSMPFEDDAVYALDRVHRLLGRRQRVDGTQADRRTHAHHAQLIDRGAGPTRSAPAYIFEGARLWIDDGTEVNGGDAESDAVHLPVRTVRQESVGVDVRKVLVSLNPERYIFRLEAEEPFMEFEASDAGSVVYLQNKATDAYETAHITEVVDSGPEKGTAIATIGPATGSADPQTEDWNGTWYRHAFVDLPDMFEDAIVQYAGALALASAGDERFGKAVERFNELLAPYRTPMFDLREQQTDG